MRSLRRPRPSAANSSRSASAKGCSSPTTATSITAWSRARFDAKYEYTVSVATPASSATSRMPEAAHPLVVKRRLAASISAPLVSCARLARIGDS